MKLVPTTVFLVSAVALSLAACSRKEPEATASAGEATTAAPTDPVASAESAAPKAIAAAASVVTVDDKGAMKELRKGTNGWTCMPDSPATPGPDPMCMDKNATEWAMAWMAHKTPPAEKPGVMYMLEGGTDASNTDPYATKPDGDWIKTGPHLMVVGSAAALNGYPSGAKPDTSAPYVMWAGTPYAHLMVPVK